MTEVNGYKVAAMFLVVAAFVFFTGGCASQQMLAEPDKIPEGAALIRCTEYTGTAGTGLMGGGGVAADGCQCLIIGDLPPGTRIDLDSCGLAPAE